MQVLRDYESRWGSLEGFLPSPMFIAVTQRHEVAVRICKQDIHQKHIAPSLIHTFYEDGCAQEYKGAANGRGSILHMLIDLCTHRVG